VALAGSTGMARTVWILGAGFSRALGGPLLDDLFSSDYIRMVNATFRYLLGSNLERTCPLFQTISRRKYSKRENDVATV
jgi:hypothetical protein